MDADGADDFAQRRAGADRLQAFCEKSLARDIDDVGQAFRARFRCRHHPARCDARRPAARGVCETALRPPTGCSSGCSFGLAYWLTPTMESRRRADGLDSFRRRRVPRLSAESPARNAAAMPPSFSTSWNSAQARLASSAVRTSDEPRTARRIHDAGQLAFLLQNELGVAGDAPAEIVRAGGPLRRTRRPACCRSRRAPRPTPRRWRAACCCAGSQTRLVPLRGADVQGQLLRLFDCRPAPRRRATRASATRAAWRSP